ncbi:MipA/OmpV family protein [Noviherbaspirillum malthae]|uniref:MipA/OmpV family protein n=1 Tax=Noviherbaspirillum malthae TaxID=1260987 RepID=UPI00188E3BC9|nr:MipA/OmpV family protein [Noviherbaspirillum malthae]
MKNSCNAFFGTGQVDAGTPASVQVPGFSLGASFVLLAGLAFSAACVAQPLPLWEAGIGVAGITLPDYRGSDQRTDYILPAPYFVYRGEFLKADRNGLRAELFDNDKVEVNFSANATLPVRSKDNEARRGMPDLKPTVEVGGNIGIGLWNSSNGKMKLDFRAPLRTAITIESSPKSIGWLFSPNLNLDIRDPAGFSGWNLGMLAGPLFQSQKYNAYFYSVNDTQVLPDRRRYDASGGYSGAQFTMALSKRFPRYWVGSFLRYDSLAGATFEDSPLVRKRSALSAGIAISWVFGESSRMVDRPD